MRKYRLLAILERAASDNRYAVGNDERAKYTIAGERNSGVICLNGAAARCAMKGDIVIIIAYAQMDENEARTLKPNVVLVDENNRIVKNFKEEANSTI